MKKNTFVEGTIFASLSYLIMKILGAIYVIPFYAIVGTLGGALYFLLKHLIFMLSHIFLFFLVKEKVYIMNT